ncbi:alkaline phosphatase family protein [Kineococcus gynurae]|uniref:Alkaline phosphatase family protein n=1 Tax=Kineococcus gynurae TaxID=452979 RepID=A0ABV5LN56_9ACTN
MTSSVPAPRSPSPSAVPGLLLGPMLRHVGEHRATLWVETEAPGRVEVLVDVPDSGTVRAGAETLTLHGHHYALVIVEDLPAAANLTYRVEVDGSRVWPPEGSTRPPSRIRTLDVERDVRLSFGSCRRAGGHTAEDVDRLGVDALTALAERLCAEDPEAAGGSWPDVLLFVGDQVYADLPNPEVVGRLRERHAGRPQSEQLPTEQADADVSEEIGDFEEYTWLYHETWGGDPRTDHEGSAGGGAVRWLLSTVPSVMLLDDHDLRDDWNTSASWKEEISAQPWWRDRVTGAFASYWVYQHLGNLSPDEIAADPLLARLRAEPDPERRDEILDEFARLADADPSSARWSFVRDLGETRLVAVDSRCARQLTPGDRRITDAEEWEWVTRQAHGEGRLTPVRHLLLATTLPPFLVHGIHHAEGWNEALADGRWGRRVQAWSENFRQVADLEHWSAFRRSFDDLIALLRDVCTGEQAPASILVLSGDVHCSYTAEVQLPGVDRTRTEVHQLVMSPFRNPLSWGMRFAFRILDSRPLRALSRGLAQAAGVQDPPVRWQVQAGPWFDNGVMTVALDPAGGAGVTVEHAGTRDGRPVLRRTAARALTPAHRRVPVTTA